MADYHGDHLHVADIYGPVPTAKGRTTAIFHIAKLDTYRLKLTLTKISAQWLGLRK